MKINRSKSLFPLRRRAVKNVPPVPGYSVWIPFRTNAYPVRPKGYELIYEGTDANGGYFDRMGTWTPATANKARIGGWSRATGNCGLLIEPEAYGLLMAPTIPDTTNWSLINTTIETGLQEYITGQPGIRLNETTASGKHYVEAATDVVWPQRSMASVIIRIPEDKPRPRVWIELYSDDGVWGDPTKAPRATFETDMPAPSNISTVNGAFARQTDLGNGFLHLQVMAVTQGAGSGTLRIGLEDIFLGDTYVGEDGYGVEVYHAGLQGYDYADTPAYALSPIVQTSPVALWRLSDNLFLDAFSASDIVDTWSYLTVFTPSDPLKDDLGPTIIQNLLWSTENGVMLQSRFGVIEAYRKAYGSPAGALSSGAPAMEAGKSYGIGLTYGSGDLKLYVRDLAAGTTTTATEAFSDDPGLGGPVFNPLSQVNTRWHPGCHKHIVAYPRVLSESEVNQVLDWAYADMAAPV